MTGVHDGLQGFVLVHADIHGDYVYSGHHDFAHYGLAEFQNARDQLLFFVRHRAVFRSEYLYFLSERQDVEREQIEKRRREFLYQTSQEYSPGSNYDGNRVRDQSGRGQKPFGAAQSEHSGNERWRQKRRDHEQRGQQQPVLRITEKKTVGYSNGRDHG